MSKTAQVILDHARKLNRDEILAVVAELVQFARQQEDLAPILSTDQEAELLARSKDLDDHPESSIPLDRVLKRLRARPGLASYRRLPLSIAL